MFRNDSDDTYKFFDFIRDFKDIPPQDDFLEKYIAVWWAEYLGECDIRKKSSEIYLEDKKILVKWDYKSLFF